MTTLGPLRGHMSFRNSPPRAASPVVQGAGCASARSGRAQPCRMCTRTRSFVSYSSRRLRAGYSALTKEVAGSLTPWSRQQGRWPCPPGGMARARSAEHGARPCLRRRTPSTVHRAQVRVTPVSAAEAPAGGRVTVRRRQPVAPVALAAYAALAPTGSNRHQTTDAELAFARTWAAADIRRRA